MVFGVNSEVMRGRNEVASSVKTTTQVFYPFCCPRLLCHQLVCPVVGFEVLHLPSLETAYVDV